MTERTAHYPLIKSTLTRQVAGCLLCLLALVLLWLNEGALDVGKVARSSIALSGDNVQAETGRRLVSVTGQLTAVEPLGDPQFLPPGPYIKLVRKVEVFMGKGWTAKPKEARALKVKPASYLAATARIGAFTIDPQMMEFPPPVGVKLESGKYYIYVGSGNVKKPRPSDLRVSFAAVAGSQEVTAFGKKQKDLLAPYVTIEYRFYKIFKGNRDQALAQLPAQHTGRLWSLRLVGFLTLWFGLALFRWPVELLLKVRPALQILKMSWLTFGSALTVSLLVIVISIYSVAFWLVVLLSAAVYFGFRKLRARK